MLNAAPDVNVPRLDLRAWLALRLQARRRERAGEAGGGLARGLVAPWCHAELSGNRVDDVDDAILAEVGGTVPGVPGVIGNRAEFDGTKALVSADGPQWSPTANGFAVAFWYEWAGWEPGENNWYAVSVWDDSVWPTGASWHIYVNPLDASLTAQVMTNTGWDYLVSSAPVYYGAHIVLTYNAGTWSLYADAVLVASLTVGLSPATGSLGVGGHTNTGDSFGCGAIDELAVWSRGLSADDVRLLFNDDNGLGYPY